MASLALQKSLSAFFHNNVNVGFDHQMMCDGITALSAAWFLTPINKLPSLFLSTDFTAHVSLIPPESYKADKSKHDARIENNILKHCIQHTWNEQDMTALIYMNK